MERLYLTDRLKQPITRTDIEQAVLNFPFFVERCKEFEAELQRAKGNYSEIIALNYIQVFQKMFLKEFIKSKISWYLPPLNSFGRYWVKTQLIYFYHLMLSDLLRRLKMLNKEHAKILWNFSVDSDVLTGLSFWGCDSVYSINETITEISLALLNTIIADVYAVSSLSFPTHETFQIILDGEVDEVEVGENASELETVLKDKRLEEFYILKYSTTLI
ncbi:MAG TPA: hypothetical protein VI815_02555 [Candidatus Nanoarchaeia archaeon]|nr:hypothetical protein [Candidatus Nanoarchaeia archaeon]